MAHSATVERSTQNESASEAVVSAVAALTDSDPVSMQPLYDVVDPDALDTMFEASGHGPARSSPRVEFTYCGCDVVVSGAGDVRVSPSG